MVFPLRTAILEYYRNLMQSKTDFHERAGFIPFPSLLKLMIPYKVFELGIIS